jgi:hypothetical protein
MPTSGNWIDDSGPVVQTSTPSFPPGRLESVEQKLLTRLDLGKYIVSDANPLKARAVMNRLWAQFFGTRLSATLDDLGSQGQLPSHPELLDFIAAEFREGGWDFKHMIRLLVASATEVDPVVRPTYYWRLKIRAGSRPRCSSPAFSIPAISAAPAYKTISQGVATSP